MRSLLIFSLFVFVLPSFSLEISGNQSGEWTADNNPYEIVGDVTIPEYEDLVIYEGVEVLVTGDFQITVEGSLQIFGTETDSVRFSHQNAEIAWSGIRFENELEQSVVQYTQFQHAENAMNSIHSPIHIEHCHFTNNQKAIHIFAIGNSNPPEIVIDSCLIENSQQNGIYIVENSNVIISQNELRQNALDESPRAAIMLSSQGGECSPTIQDNYIHHNIWQGIAAWDLTGDGSNIAPFIEDNEISYNLSGIYLYYASGMIRNNHIHHNFVSGNPNSGAGIMLQGAGTNPICTFNEIHNNFCAVYLYQEATGNFGCIDNYTDIDDGENHFYENWDESGNLWSIYNASSQNVPAQNNIWDSNDTEEIQSTIMDGNSNASYGIVEFLPIYQETNVTVSDVHIQLQHGNYPNPFNPETRIFFQTDTDTTGEIVIFNSKGQKVKHLFSGQILKDKRYDILWEGRDYFGKKVSSGIYFYQIKTEHSSHSKKMLLLQ